MCTLFVFKQCGDLILWVQFLILYIKTSYLNCILTTFLLSSVYIYNCNLLQNVILLSKVKINDFFLAKTDTRFDFKVLTKKSNPVSNWVKYILKWDRLMSSCQQPSQHSWLSHQIYWSEGPRFESCSQKYLPFSFFKPYRNIKWSFKT